MNELSDPFDIPSHWKWAVLGDVVTIRNGYAFKSSNYQDDGVLLVRQSNLGDETVDLKGKRLPKEYLSEYEGYIVTKGDVLVGMSGSVGKLSVYKSEEPALQNQRTGLLQFEDDRFKSYIRHYFRILESNLLSRAKGVAVQNISASEIEETPVPLPPLPEQRRIVAKIEELFSNLDAGMGDLQTAERQLERYRLSVLQAAVEGRLTADWRETHDPEPADQLLERILEKRQDQWEERYRWERYDSKGKEPPSGWKDRYSPPQEPEETTSDILPDGWCWITIDQITQTVTKESSPGHQGFEYKEEGIPFLRSQNVRWGELDLEGIEHLDESFNEAQSKSVIEEDDVFLNIVGASIGRAAKADERLDGANMNQAVALIRPVLSSALPEYMVIYLLSPTMQNYIEQKKVEVARANLNLGEIKSFEIPLPPLQEMKELVAEVNRQLSIADNAKKSSKQEVTRAERLWQSILKQAFSGQLVPHEDGASPPSLSGTTSEDSDTGSRNDVNSDVEDLMGSADPSKQIEMDL